MPPRLRRTLSPRVAAALFVVATAGLIPIATTGCSPRRPNVVLVVIDTLRADHLSLYGYERPTSPWLERLARRGVSFENHISHASQTVPATLSLLLSQLPAEHGFVHRSHGQFSKVAPRYPQDMLFLSEVFKQAGYATAAFTANPFLGPRNGFDQGLDAFVHGIVADGKVARASLAWLGTREDELDEPFFLYLHLMQVHAPYEPPPRFAAAYPTKGGSVLRGTGEMEVDDEDLAATIAAYDACINFVDELVGELVVELHRLGLADDTIFAVTSDHGEEFHEHRGLGHGTTVYGELLRVPLILVYPRRLEAGTRVHHLTQHLDLAPTLLDLAGIPKPESFHGTSVFAPAGAILAEEGPWRAAYGEGFKLIRNLEQGRSELYEVEDTLDQRPLTAGARGSRLDRDLDGYLELEAQRPSEPSEAEAGASGWSPEELEQLRRLGYVE